ncbi:MAGUK p55 subfamily member 7-like [Arapaima gigas]
MSMFPGVSLTALQQSLLFAHDVVARKQYDPVLLPLPQDLSGEQDSVKIVQLVKSKEPLGATVKRDEHTGAIVVARIMKGGCADRSGLIHEGDELREVNGIPMENKSLDEIIPIMAQSQGAITFKVIPGNKVEMETIKPKMFVRSLFDYNPNEDAEIPCKEAGLTFTKGDILQILSQDDTSWWQAKHCSVLNARAGLIPSRQFQESRRFSLKRPPALPPAQALRNCRSSSLRRSFRLSSRRRKTRRPTCGGQWSKHNDAVEVATYEEVVPYHRPPWAWPRLVLLVGPSGVGINELKKKLVLSDPQRYDVTVPHTTRPKKAHESDGVEYTFIPKYLFLTELVNNKFVEYGEYGGHFYGTSLAAVRSVLARNKVCLLDVQPQTVIHLRTPEFKPFVVYVKPPPLEHLRTTRRKAKLQSWRDEMGQMKTFLEEDFQEMVESAKAMEAMYGYLFDKVIVNDDLAESFLELQATLRKLETEEQWIPAAWMISRNIQ